MVGHGVDYAMLEGSSAGSPASYNENDAGVWVVSLRSLRNFLTRDYEKARTLRSLPIFLLWLTSLTVLIMISGVANPLAYNVLYHLEHAHYIELELEAWEHLSSPENFWDWCGTVTSRLWHQGPGQVNYPMGFFLIRQFRVAPAEISPPSIISPAYLTRVPDHVLPEWSDGSASRKPYGPGGAWIPDADLADPISVLSVNTEFNSYDDPNDAFTIALSYLTDYADITAALAELKDEHFIDNATRVVIVDVLTYNPSVGSFAANHMYIEFFASGGSLSSHKAYPFRVYDLDSAGDRAIFALDCLAVLGLLFVLASLFKSVWVNKELGQMWISVWLLFEVVLVTFVAVCYSYRMWLWWVGPELQHDSGVAGASSPDRYMYTTLVEYGYRFERGSTFMALSVTMAWLRVLRILQHNDRLGVLSLTIKYAAGELFSLFVIFLVVLFGYSLGATALFGADFEDMSSLPSAMGYLCRLLVSAEVGSDWAALSQTHPEWVWVFMGSFMVLSWLIILNTVLAIVSGSFASVQAACGGKVASWSLESLYWDVVRMRRTLCGQGFCSASRAQTGRRKAIKLLNNEGKKHADGMKQDIPLEEWTELVSGIYNSSEARSIYERAEKDPRMKAIERDNDSTADSVTDRVSRMFTEGDVRMQLMEIKDQIGVLQSSVHTNRVYRQNSPKCPVCGMSARDMPFCGRTGDRHVFQPASVQKSSQRTPFSPSSAETVMYTGHSSGADPPGSPLAHGPLVVQQPPEPPEPPLGLSPINVSVEDLLAASGDPVSSDDLQRTGRAPFSPGKAAKKPNGTWQSAFKHKQPTIHVFSSAAPARMGNRKGSTASAATASPAMSPTAVAASSPLTEAFAKRRNAGSPKPRNHSEIEMERMSGPDTILAEGEYSAVTT
ncbi:Polycystin-2 [Diplonema papillatum]|nr:Polycystin-2 [Diplonema papillatum]